MELGEQAGCRGSAGIKGGCDGCPSATPCAFGCETGSGEHPQRAQPSAASLGPHPPLRSRSLRSGCSERPRSLCSCPISQLLTGAMGKKGLFAFGNTTWEHTSLGINLSKVNFRGRVGSQTNSAKHCPKPRHAAQFLLYHSVTEINALRWRCAQAWRRDITGLGAPLLRRTFVWVVGS